MQLLHVAITAIGSVFTAIGSPSAIVTAPQEATIANTPQEATTVDAVSTVDSSSLLRTLPLSTVELYSNLIILNTDTIVSYTSVCCVIASDALCYTICYYCYSTVIVTVATVATVLHKQ